MPRQRKKAGIVLMSNTGKLLIVKQAESMKWGIPKGKMNWQDKKSFWRCALREFKEETDINLEEEGKSSIIQVFRTNNIKFWVVKLQEPLKTTVDVSKSAGEISDYQWVTLESLARSFTLTPKQFNVTIRELLKRLISRKENYFSIDYNRE